MRRSALIALLALTAVISPAAQESPRDRYVSLVIGCLQAPAGYRVVWSEGAIDYFGGYVEPPEKNWQLIWRAGTWKSLLDPTEARRVLWSKTVVIDDRSATLGHIEESGQALVVASFDWIEFALPASISNAEALLKGFARRYRTDCRGLDVLPAEKEGDS